MNPNPTNPTLKCGHTGPDWNGEGDCIICARDRILGTKQDSDTNVVISKQELREYLKSKGWLWHESHVITNDCMDELEVHMQQMLSDTVNKVLDELDTDIENHSCYACYDAWKGERRKCGIQKLISAIEQARKRWK